MFLLKPFLHPDYRKNLQYFFPTKSENGHISSKFIGCFSIELSHPISAAVRRPSWIDRPEVIIQWRASSFVIVSQSRTTVYRREIQNFVTDDLVSSVGWLLSLPLSPPPSSNPPSLSGQRATLSSSLSLVCDDSPIGMTSRVRTSVHEF